MVFITEDLIRKRAEHNECELSTLEEVSLHQLDIERIEHIDKWCRELKILYLQSNLIPKLENLSRLKELEYLNLALNNITLIENLEGCESLNKLDLTINFIGQITCIETLQANSCLHELYLTGNPCTDFMGYRDYVIAALPQLIHLDGKEINRSERILAVQSFTSLRCEMMRQQSIYLEKLAKEKENEKVKAENEGKAGFQNDWYTDTQNAHLNKETSDQKAKDGEDDFWNKPTAYTPESRIETHRYMEEKRKEKENEKSKYPNHEPPQREIRYFNNDGRPLNINQAQVDFSLNDDEDNGEYVLDVSCYKYLDTSLIDIDVQPTHIRIIIKGKVFQLTFNEEVSPYATIAKRSQTTGHLVLTLPKLKTLLDGNLRKKKEDLKKTQEIRNENKTTSNSQVKNIEKHIEKLEVSEKTLPSCDIYNIVENVDKNKQLNNGLFSKKKKKTKCLNTEEVFDEHFVDNPDVPALE